MAGEKKYLKRLKGLLRRRTPGHLWDPNYEEQLALRHARAELLLHNWYRWARSIAVAIGLVALGRIVLAPDLIETLVGLIKYIISSGRGFALPVTLLVIYAVPRILDLVLPGRRERGTAKPPGQPPSGD